MGRVPKTKVSVSLPPEFVEFMRNVARASLVCMMAGADFIKTSTGKEPVNATLPVSLVMARMIRAYHERTGFKVGFKPAGGVRTGWTAGAGVEYAITHNLTAKAEYLYTDLGSVSTPLAGARAARRPAPWIPSRSRCWPAGCGSGGRISNRAWPTASL